MAKKKIIILAIALSLTVISLGILPLIGCSNSSDQEAVLSMKDGEVYIKESGDNNWVEAQVGVKLGKGDSIKVNDDSRAELTFFEGSIIELEEGTTVSISELSITKDTGSTTITLEEEVGKTISRVVELTDSASNYEIETPACVAAVRGSVMEVYVDEEGITKVANMKGSISATSQGVEVQIPENMESFIIPGQPPFQPSPIAGEGAGLIDITKSIMSVDGDTITYLYEVTNLGDTPQSNVYVLDDEVDAINYVSGDTNSNGMLDPGETWLYTGTQETQ